MSTIFGQRLHAIRLARKISVNRIVKATGVDRTSLYRYERGDGEPLLSNAVALAEFFQVSLDYLAKGEVK